MVCFLLPTSYEIIKIVLTVNLNQLSIYTIQKLHLSNAVLHRQRLLHAATILCKNYEQQTYIRLGWKGLPGKKTLANY
jgi:hypothetical protein